MIMMAILEHCERKIYQVWKFYLSSCLDKYWKLIGFCHLFFNRIVRWWLINRKLLQEPILFFLFVELLFCVWVKSHHKMRILLRILFVELLFCRNQSCVLHIQRGEDLYEALSIILLLVTSFDHSQCSYEGTVWIPSLANLRRLQRFRVIIRRAGRFLLLGTIFIWFSTAVLFFLYAICFINSI